ncbi:cell surface protein SprA [soil metagenome]
MKLKSKIIFQSTFLFLIIVNLFALSNISFSQGRRGLDFFVGSYNPTDTGNVVLVDSLELARLDSLRRIPIDSTARVKYFTYERQYDYGVNGNSTLNPLLLSNSSSIQTTVTFDSLDNVIIRQQFNGEDIKAPLILTLDQYLHLRSAIRQKSIFSDLANEKFKGTTDDDLTQLFQKFTNITIPLPFKSETIFGPPTISLNINGAIDITASYQNISSDQLFTTATSTATQKNINFKQDVQVTAKGKVGDKLTIDADYNTQRTFDFENQLKLKYEGYADEVIQKIEAGNVSLETKSSLIQSTQALFGVRGEFKLGPLTLVGVISQKKSKQESRDFSGGSSDQEYNLKPTDYSDNHYFIDTLYKTAYRNIFTDGNNVFSDSNAIDVTNLQVWVQTEVTNTNKRNAILDIDLNPYSLRNLGDTANYVNTPNITHRRVSGYFRKIDASEYSINLDAGFISLKTSVPDQYAVGITYQIRNSNKKVGLNDNAASTGPANTLILKLVKLPSLTPSDTLAWAQKMKNIYRLPVSNLAKDGFTLNVNYIDPSANTESPTLPSGRNLLSILKLDRFDVNGSAGSDNLFDYREGYTVLSSSGDIIFPSLEPFKNDISAVPSDSIYAFNDMYSLPKTQAQLSTRNNYYNIKGKARGTAGISNTISLGFNIVQGSVLVKNGNIALDPNVDYSVDYSTGTVVIKNASALASKDLKITYETNELLQIASKTLLGVRGDYKINDKSSFGFTFMNLKQETLNDKVRIGEEPTNNSMFGIDFTTELKSKFLTKLVNLLPGYTTKEESGFVLKTEAALINNDPNTRKSQIPTDNNESVAYIDDMEGAKKIISLGTTYNTWKIGSIPFTFMNPTLIDPSPVPDSTRQLYRARMNWYNISNDALIKDIFPLKDVQSGQDRVTPFYLTFRPADRGTYNYNSQFPDTMGNTPEHRRRNFNGIMKYLNSTSTDLVSENINFIEFNMKVESLTSLAQDQNAKMYVELGFISVDGLPNGKIDTEDKNANGLLDLNEDNGLDGLTDAQEDSLIVAKYHLPSGSLGPDPSLDNNIDTGYDLSKINGTEKNAGVDGNTKPDTEDLNGTGSNAFRNSYFQYEVSLDTTANTRIVGRGYNGWAQYRIPLSEFTKKIGDIELTNIQYVRIWMGGCSDSVRLGMVELNLVGNQWVKPTRTDTSYSISVVSIEENPQIYQSPVGGDVLRQTVRNQNNQDTKSNEQSLSINVKNLTTYQGRKSARKDYGSTPLDLFNYKTLKLFVNGDPSFQYVNENSYDAAMVVRFGTDSNNFYEYRAPLHPDVRPGQPWNAQNEVTINFADLTSIKVSRDSVNKVVRVPVPNGPPGSEYIIKGNPALNIIREFVLSVEKNRTGQETSITGSVWFNEMRLIRVNNDNGYAFNVSAGLKLADLMQLNFAFSKVDPNFHTIDSRVGTRQNGISWDFSGTLNLHKIVNNLFVSMFSDKWANFLNLPLTYRHSEGFVQPKYYPGTDILIDNAVDQKYKQVLLATNDEALATAQSEQIRIQAQTLTVRNEVSLNGLSFNFPGNNYLLKNIVNKLAFNFAASFGNSRDVTYESKNDFSYNGGVNFGTDFGVSDVLNLNIGKIIKLGDKYKDAKMYFFFPFIGLTPLFANNFVANTDFNRSENEQKQRQFLNPDQTARVFNANRGFKFDWKFLENWIVDLTGNYSFRAGSDLTGLETLRDSLRTPRTEAQIFSDIFFNQGIINFGRDLNYVQTVGMNPKFNFPFIDKFINFTMNYNVNYGWTDPNQLVNTGYTVGFQNTISTNANIKLNEIFNIFKGSDAPAPPPGSNPNGTNKDPQPPKGNKFNRLTNKFSSIGDEQDPINILKVLKTFVPDNINVTYAQSNQVLNSSIDGRPGFGNFWLYPTAKENLGPSRMFQLGFSRDPGRRVGNLQNVTDQLNITNDITVSTMVTPVIPDAIRLSLNFKTSFGNSVNQTANTNALGLVVNPSSRNDLVTKGYSTFFIGDVEKFDYASTVNGKPFADAVKTGLAKFPFPNWVLSISGLEKLPMFSEFATSVTLDNSFIADYKEGISTDILNTQTPTAQQITQSFSPLIGLNVNFKQVLGGSFTTNFKINSSKVYSVIPANNLIQVTNTSDWSLTANFTKSGFEIPLFGLSLQNDISFALTVSKTVNNPIDYAFQQGYLDKRIGSGTNVLTINPTVQYSLSSRVGMQLFFKYIKTTPTEGTVATIPRTNSEGGLNIKISIQ